MDKKIDEARCNFCGKDASEVEKIFSAEGSNICNECVYTCWDISHKSKLQKAKEEFQKGLSIPTKLKEHLDNYVIGQEEAKKILSVALYSHYKRIDKPIHNNIEIEKSNILLIGPTGSGKTLLAKSLARIMNVPFAIADATALTEAGYVGEDVESILSRLLASANFDLEKAQKGIIYIDEIDKIATRRDGSTNVRDISGDGVQQGLLKILEGGDVYVPLKGSRKNSSAETILFDTTHVLFICGGAFVDLVENDKLNKQNKIKEMGFVTRTTSSNNTKEIASKDLIRFGLIPEFIGRIPIITSLNQLSVEDLVKVLTEPNNAVIKQYQALFELDGVDLEFSDDALETIAQMAEEKCVGARGLRGIIEKIMLPLQYELPAKEGVEKCIISKDFIEGRAKVELKFIKKQKRRQNNG